MGIIIDSSYSVGGLTGRGKDITGWEIEKRFVKEIAADFKTEDYDDGIRLAVADISKDVRNYVEFFID